MRLEDHETGSINDGSGATFDAAWDAMHASRPHY
jgi:hypothetical protein